MLEMSVTTIVPTLEGMYDKSYYPVIVRRGRMTESEIRAFVENYGSGYPFYHVVKGNDGGYVATFSNDEDQELVGGEIPDEDRGHLALSFEFSSV